MKIIKIDDAWQYELLYEAAIARPAGYNIQQARIIGKVLDKFEMVGKVSEVKKGISLYTPNRVPNQIELEDSEFALLLEVFMEMAWTGPGVRKAVLLEDQLNG